MANEIEILTENAAGTSWVDLLPGSAATGYQPQNTNIEANRNGVDKFAPYYDSVNDNIVIPPSGIVDEGGLPFVVKSEITLDASGMTIGTKYYLKLIAGSGNTYRSLSLVTTPGTYDASRNAFYESGDRVLDWILEKETATTMLFSIRVNQHVQIYDMPQPLRSTDDVEFNSLDLNILNTEIIDGGFYSYLNGMAAGTTALSFPSTNYFSNLADTNSTTYVSIWQTTLRDFIFKSAHPTLSSITGARVHYYNGGSSGGELAQFRVLVNGISQYESALERAVQNDFNITCDLDDIITFEARTEGNETAHATGEDYSFSFNRDLNNSERIIENLHRAYIT